MMSNGEHQAKGTEQAAIEQDAVPEADGTAIDDGRAGSSHQLSLALPLPPSVVITPVGADTVGIPARDALDALRAVKPVGAAWRWIVGDLVLSLCGHEIRDLHLAWQAIAGMDLDSHPAVVKSVLVAEAFPIEKRRGALSWSHHEAVHHLPEVERDEWLRLAEQGDGRGAWSCHTLTARVMASREQHRQDPLPGTSAAGSWRQAHASTITALDRVFRDDPGAVVLVTGDGKYRKLGAVEAEQAGVIEVKGTPS